MTSVQENKNELEAAVRYCESAISRAKATIESMEFRQQAATKAWHEQTGREAALEREVRELKNEVAALEQSEHDLKFQLGEREDKWDEAMNENRELQSKIQTMEQTMQLQKDQIAMFQRKMSRMNEVDR